MKKIFTLLFALGLLTAAANAQQGSRDNRDKPQYDQRNPQQNGQRDNGQYDQRNSQPGQWDHQYDQRNDHQNSQWDKNNDYSNGRDMNWNNDHYRSNDFYGKSIEMQIAQINRKYDFQVRQVRNDFFMRRFEKMRTLRFLDEQRQQDIRMVYARAASMRDRQHDRGYDSNHRY